MRSSLDAKVVVKRSAWDVPQIGTFSSLLLSNYCEAARGSFRRLTVLRLRGECSA